MDLIKLAALYPIVSDVLSKVKGRATKEDLMVLLLAELNTSFKKHADLEIQILEEIRSKVESIQRTTR